jgi:prepilin-type N-terminal cleavage/methylation domain-containing protein
MDAMSEARTLTLGRRPHLRDPRAGFSLIEVLFALALLAATLIGVLPLFARSMRSNVEAGQIDEVTSRCRQQVEAMLSLPFDAPELTLPAGAPALESRQVFSPRLLRWVDEAALGPGEASPWSRSIRVRQWSASAISDGDPELEDDEALPGGADPALVHLKEIEVRVESGATVGGRAAGARKSILLRVLKSR